jgi:hypothetical protein
MPRCAVAAPPWRDCRSGADRDRTDRPVRGRRSGRRPPLWPGAEDRGGPLTRQTPVTASLGGSDAEGRRSDHIKRTVLALLWHSCHRTKSEASPADWTSQAQGAGQMVKQPTPDGRQGRLWRRPGSFSPPWRRASVDAAGTSRRSMSAAHAGADRAMNGPRSDRARALP